MTNHRQALAHGIPVLQDREDVKLMYVRDGKVGVVEGVAEADWAYKTVIYPNGSQDGTRLYLDDVEPLDVVEGAGGQLTLDVRWRRAKAQLAAE